MRVLLVEDEADTRDMLGRALERAGHDCLAARSAEDALGKVAAHGAVDVVVTDVVMGGSDRRGLLLMNELRAAGVRAPIIVITAYADVAWNAPYFASRGFVEVTDLSPALTALLAADADLAASGRRIVMRRELG